MSRFFYAPGMCYPYWIVGVENDWPNRGDRTTVATNSAASTDMGDLHGGEFFNMFPNAFEISHEQYLEQNIDPADGLAWAMLIRRANES